MIEKKNMFNLLLQCLNTNYESDIIRSLCEINYKLICEWRSQLSQDNKLIIGVDNAGSLRYDCGDYPDGPVYTKTEICELLRRAGIEYKCYSVYPCLNFPQLIYADDFFPNEELKVRYFPKYNHPDKVYEIEEFLIDNLIADGQFHEKANGFLFVCSLSANLPHIKHITLSSDRLPEKALATIIYENGTVEKKALYQEGIQQLKNLKRNMISLAENGIPVVQGTLKDNSYIMPFIDAPLATTYLKNVLKKDKTLFVSLFDRFVELLHMSSNIEGFDQYGPILEKGYIDMIPLNAFFKDGDFLFFDQEFYIEHCPIKALIYRALIIPYCGDLIVEKRCPLQEMLKRYGLLENQLYWQNYAQAFLKSLHDPVEWSELNNKYGRNDIIVNGNQKNRNMKKKNNCFTEIGDKKVYIFGTGKFADKFVDMYHNDYSIVAAFDNDKSKHGIQWKGITVFPPEALKKMDPGYVMICVKDYQPVVDQLKKLGIDNVGVYNAHEIYPGRQANDIPYTGKQYHIGYCAGVYDLFHIGHVNIFKHAKELCDYLIVGVVTDDGVRINKHKEPFIPYEERMEMVSSCKYVDEAVEIPLVYCRTPDMFEKYHFDVQFSGSDYEHDPGWLSMKRYLNEHGAEMIFFPYTESTSSTKIKLLIDKGLLE